MDSKHATFDAFNVGPPTEPVTCISYCSIHQATTISTAELDAVAAFQGLDPATFARPGDFLVVRTGFTQQYVALAPHDQAILPYREGNDAQFLGMQATDEMLRWLWDKKLALVGSDNPAFESLPLGLGFIDGVQRSLHQVFIGGWGQSIGVFVDCLTQIYTDVQRRS